MTKQEGIEFGIDKSTVKVPQATKQEEIREGIELLVAKKFSKLMPDRFPNDWLSLNGEGLTRQILEYLHSQGVVIKVERVFFSVTSSYVLSAHGVYARINKEALSEQGYVAVEPLIEGK